MIYNGETFPAECAREDVHVLALPFTQIADELGDARAANMVMLGALLEIADALPQVEHRCRAEAAGQESAAGWRWTSARWRGDGSCIRSRPKRSREVCDEG